MLESRFLPQPSWPPPTPPPLIVDVCSGFFGALAWKAVGTLLWFLGAVKGLRRGAGGIHCCQSFSSRAPHSSSQLRTDPDPPPLGSDPSGAGCCVKRRDCVLYCEQGLLLPYTAHLTPHIQTRTMPAWEGSRGSCVRGGMLWKDGGKLLCRGPAVKDRSSHSKLKMTPSDSHVNSLFSCAPIIADVNGEETPYGFLALLWLLLEDGFGLPKWRRHFVFMETLKHPV